jgi:Kef-type K+ transport system membrane component KefB
MLSSTRERPHFSVILPEVHPLLFAGLCTVLALAGKAICLRLRVPALLAYLLTGFLLRTFGSELMPSGSDSARLLSLFADLGLACLLFQVGLQSDVKSLRSELPRALGLWLGDFTLASITGFSVAFFILDAGLIASLFVATALSATSVAVSVSVWEEQDAVHSPLGQRLLDVAELDDISAIALLVVVMSVAPLLQSGGDVQAMRLVIGERLVALTMAFVGYGLTCFVFARFIEHRISRWLFEFEHRLDGMLSVFAIGLCLAAVADWLGLSVAVGALSAGLIFSGDHQAREHADAFAPVIHLLAPFFFISVGYGIEANALFGAIGPGIVIVAAAIVGKVAGVGGAAIMQGERRAAWLLGVSMIPRAEIAMVVAHTGRTMGSAAMSAEIYGALAMMSAVTCVVGPILLRPMIKRYV